MIYDIPEASSPISQGDIFFSIPIVDLPADELSVIGDDENLYNLAWEDFAASGQKVAAVLAVRPTIAIVGTQECDALRAPNITLFEVRPFREVERKSKDTNKPAKWVALITQHARINQKWFYLPADEKVGFSEKMGADFFTPIRIPREALERMTSFRRGRLNDVAKQHFRERVAEFFRRYAYDEWYPFTLEELAEYRKSHPTAEPFPWQQRAEAAQEEERERYFNNYVDANRRWTAELVTVGEEHRKFVSNNSARLERAEQLVKSSKEDKRAEAARLFKLISADMNVLSDKFEASYQRISEVIPILEENLLAYLKSFDTSSEEERTRFSSIRKTADDLRGLFLDSKNTTKSIINAVTNLPGTDVEEFKQARARYIQVLESISLKEVEFESFAMRVLFVIDEKLGHISL